MNEPFDMAWRFALLSTSTFEIRARASDVLKIPIAAGYYVPLFRSPRCMALWVSEYTALGRNVGVVGAPTQDTLTDLLAELKKSGVTHIAINPELGAEPDLISIDRAIIGFVMCG